MDRTANLLVANVEIESDQVYHRAYKVFEVPDRRCHSRLVKLSEQGSQALVEFGLF